MPRRSRRKSRSGIYHVILRGANRQEIFHHDKDRLRFLAKLKQFSGKEFQVMGWCLMNNHVHLMIKEGRESISSLMKRVGVSYARYYNFTYATNGHLFQDRFISEVVESEIAVLRVIRYIHMNPVKAGMVDHPEEYVWSSCRLYFGQVSYPVNLLNTSTVCGLFSREKDTAKGKLIDYHRLQEEYDGIDAWPVSQKRMTDEEARIKVIEVIGKMEIPQVKSLPKVERDEVLRRGRR
ncbi:transposase [Halobacillus salinus]|uniref:Transposase n=1 Tax=Halobacillus salinus TaxID=192814 RepID=A0A4Z0GXA7_9BACI|nr:transposase [Halobacillus salinus]TGB02459.1 transposase [Halobacillus salinus]